MPHFEHHSEENYLKTLYKLEDKQLSKVNNIALSKALSLNPATVLEMVRKLKEKKLVQVQADKSINLTDKGRTRALSIIRKHRIWEVFLVEKLNYKWSEVHDLAEQLEHIESEDLIKRLEDFLGHPKIDPHGDPIPDQNGKIKRQKSQPLSIAPIKKKLKICALGDSSEDFLNYLDRFKISIGDIVEITDKQEFDGSVMISHNRSVKTLSREAATNLLINEA